MTSLDKIINMVMFRYFGITKSEVKILSVIKHKPFLIRKSCLQNFSYFHREILLLRSKALIILSLKIVGNVWVFFNRQAKIELCSSAYFNIKSQHAFVE